MVCGGWRGALEKSQGARAKALQHRHNSNLATTYAPVADTCLTYLRPPPIAPTKAAEKDSVGYDIYDLYDLGEFDQKGSIRTNWGTKGDLLALVNTAKDHGVVTYIDAVLNHKFGADRTEKFGATEVDSNDRTKETSDLYDIEVTF